MPIGPPLPTSGAPGSASLSRSRRVSKTEELINSYRLADSIITMIAFEIEVTGLTPNSKQSRWTSGT